jgi:hypothetical protein
LFQAYLAAASFTNHAGDLTLYLALQEDRHNWTTGISSLVEADLDALQLCDIKIRSFILFYWLPHSLLVMTPSHY